jgi:hypothetical protein
VVLALSALLLAAHLRQGWIPHDEGTLGLSAERVLQGDLPHRDFDEVYTGGLSYLNALAFRLFGVNLLAPRLVLFAWFLAWVPVLYYLATRLASPLAGAGLTLLAVVWSVPNYAAAVPSWYNLFLATFGTAALFRHLETGHRRWLVVAGLAGGLSCLIKIAGLYFVAGGLLFLVFEAQAASAGSAPAGRTPRAYRALLIAGLAVLLALLVRLVQGRVGPAESVHFVLPGAVLAAVVLAAEWRGPPGADRERFRALFGHVLPFLGGVALPIVLFVAPFAAVHAAGDLANGVFVLPAKRLTFAAMRPLPVSTALWSLPLLAALYGVPSLRGRHGRREAVELGLVLAGILIAAPFLPGVYRLVWYGLRTLIPILVVVGAGVLLRGPAEAIYGPRRRQLMLLLSITGFASLVEFPFTAPVYFCYVAPLVILATAALVTSRPAPVPGPAPVGVAALIGFYLLFGLLWVNTGYVWKMGIYYVKDDQTELPRLDRARILMNGSDRDTYERLVAALREHTHGSYVFATPDCPEVYFLSGLQNPTRTLYDFFDDPSQRTTRVVSALETHEVTAVALNREARFSRGIPIELEAALDSLYPATDTVGRFLVRWRP